LILGVELILVCLVSQKVELILSSEN
jgi:hypothetical protein